MVFLNFTVGGPRVGSLRGAFTTILLCISCRSSAAAIVVEALLIWKYKTKTLPTMQTSSGTGFVFSGLPLQAK
jgi:hypothetical protein